MITVYADILFLINFIMLLFVLACVRMFLRAKKSLWLCVLGAAVGSGGYLAYVLWEKLRFLNNPLGYLGLIAATAYIAYLPKVGKELIRAVILTTAFCMCIGGACSGLFYYSNAGAYIGENIAYGFKHITLKLLVFSTAVCYIGLRFGLRLYNNIVIKKRRLYSAEIILKGKRAQLTALGDTGNTLKDAATGRYVFVCEYEAVKGLLPNCEGLKEDMYKYALDLSGELKISFAPYKSLGNAGLLFCFLPDGVYIDEKPYDNIVVGVAFGDLSEKGGFKGLINTEALYGEEVFKNASKAA